MRHIEKLKKIFSCCGKTCVKNTNGEALDELLTLAENGELGGGGGGGSSYANSLIIKGVVGTGYFSADLESYKIDEFLGNKTEIELYGGWKITDIELVGGLYSQKQEDSTDVILGFSVAKDVKITKSIDFLGMKFYEGISFTCSSTENQDFVIKIEWNE